MMGSRLVALALTLACLAQTGQAEITREDCKGLRDAELDPVEKVTRLYDCLDLLVASPLPGGDTPLQAEVLNFRKPDVYGPGWSTYPGYRNFEFAKGANGMVYLRGMMVGCPSGDHAIFTLPEGYRPKQGVRLIFATIGGSGNERARVDIVHDGRVFFWWTGRSSSCSGRSHWLTLESLTFQSER